MTMLFDLARTVVDNWEKGDLAGAVCALDGHLCELESDRESHEETIETARRLYTDEGYDGLEIDAKPFVLPSEKGAWVAAWVWVPIEECTLEPFAAKIKGEAVGEEMHLTPEETTEACREGWALFMHAGDVAELRIDCPDDGESVLSDDNAAWRLIWANPTPLHQKVLAILKEHSSAEYRRIEGYNKDLEAGH